MTPDERQRLRAIRDLYARLPKMECKGECSSSCGPIDMSQIERKAIVEATGEDVSFAPRTLTCTKLNFLGRCSIYDLRPMICRLWGISEAMKCPWGCVPEGGHLSDADSARFMHEVMRIGGGWPEMEETALGRLLEGLPDDFLQQMTPRPKIEPRKTGPAA